MKQYPSRLKYKKNHKLTKSWFNLEEKKVFFPREGILAVKSYESGKLFFGQIEACRKSIKRNIRRHGRIKINAFTNFSLTAKGLGVRMGKGKGSHSKWVCLVRKGYIVSEVLGSKLNIIKKGLKSASTRLPFKSCVVKLCY